jgi:hypothetical protein
MKVVIIASAKVYIEYSYGFPRDFRAVHLHVVPIVAFRLFLAGMRRSRWREASTTIPICSKNAKIELSVAR